MITKTIVIDLENNFTYVMDKEYNYYKLMVSGIVYHNLNSNNLRLIGFSPFDELIAKMNIDQDLNKNNNIISSKLYYNDIHIGYYTRSKGMVYVLDIFDTTNLS